MADTVPCPGCGAQVSPTGVCRFCGSTAFVEGVAGKLLPSDLKCPRCTDGAPLRGVEHEGLRADLCLKCHGVWFGMGLLEEAIRRAVKSPAPKGEGARGPAHGGMEPVRYARCPRCEGGMARVPLARKPLVIIDRCPAHGDWCDGGELAQLKTVARSRGLREALGSAPEEKDAAPPKKGGKAASGLVADPLLEELRNRKGNWGLFTPETNRMDDRKGSGIFGTRRRKRRDLFDILWEVLDLP